MSEEKKTTKKEVKKETSNVEIKAGMTVKVHEKIKEKNAKGVEKERVQIFEGIVLARKHNKEIGSTITVRKISDGIGVEKIFPLNSPLITKIEPIKQAKTRRAKLGYLRTNKKRLQETKL
jgi:large subunit ribosomal protein L19